jgi:hypothetical protein
MIIAAAMRGEFCAMPTAVMTESGEKTMSRSRIRTRAIPNFAVPPGEWAWAASPSCFSQISWVDLPTGKRPPPGRMSFRPLMPRLPMEKRTVVGPMIHLMAPRSPRRAEGNPPGRAFRLHSRPSTL